MGIMSAYSNHPELSLINNRQRLALLLANRAGGKNVSDSEIESVQSDIKFAEKQILARENRNAAAERRMANRKQRADEAEERAAFEQQIEDDAQSLSSDEWLEVWGSEFLDRARSIPDDFPGRGTLKLQVPPPMRDALVKFFNDHGVGVRAGDMDHIIELTDDEYKKQKAARDAFQAECASRAAEMKAEQKKSQWGAFLPLLCGIVVTVTAVITDHWWWVGIGAFFSLIAFARCDVPIGCICSFGLDLRNWKSPNPQLPQGAQPNEHP